MKLLKLILRLLNGVNLRTLCFRTCIVYELFTNELLISYVNQLEWQIWINFTNHLIFVFQFSLYIYSQILYIYSQIPMVTKRQKHKYMYISSDKKFTSPKLIRHRFRFRPKCRMLNGTIPRQRYEPTSLRKWEPFIVMNKNEPYQFLFYSKN